MDEHEGLGFVAVALVQTRRLRPAGWPAALGQDFFLTGYRIFTRHRTAAGRTLRGLRILRSDTDRQRMVLAGNFLTHYHYQLAHIRHARDGDHLRVEVRTPGAEADLRLEADLRDEPTRSLPPGSPFAGPGAPRPVLASAFYVENIPYRWRRGVREALPDEAPAGLPPRRPLQGVANIVRFNCSRKSCAYCGPAAKRSLSNTGAT